MVDKTQNEIMVDYLRIRSLRSELFDLANSYSGDVTGHNVAVPLHEACNCLLDAFHGMLDRLKQIL